MMLTGTKRNVRNIVDNHISTEQRTGRDLRDAYCHRSKYLLKKVQELESITRCIVNLEITHTWEKGVKKCYYSKGYEPDFTLSNVSSQSHFDTSTDDVTHKTPEKKGNLKKENLQISILQMFAGYVVSCGNLFRMRKVTHSG